MTIAQAIYIRNIEVTLFFLPLLRRAKVKELDARGKPLFSQKSHDHDKLKKSKIKLKQYYGRCSV